MRFSWLKWMLIAAALFIASGNAHAISPIKTKAGHCETIHQAGSRHHHSSGGMAHEACCCSCLGCPSPLIPPPADAAFHPGNHGESVAPALFSRLVSRILLPELDPPRAGTPR